MKKSIGILAILLVLLAGVVIAQTDDNTVTGDFHRGGPGMEYPQDTSAMGDAPGPADGYGGPQDPRMMGGRDGQMMNQRMMDGRGQMDPRMMQAYGDYQDGRHKMSIGFGILFGVAALGFILIEWLLAIKLYREVFRRK